jgi:hypothetical protein
MIAITIVDFFYGEGHEKSLWVGTSHVPFRSFEFFGYHGGQTQLAVYTEVKVSQ